MSVEYNTIESKKDMQIEIILKILICCSMVHFDILRRPLLKTRQQNVIFFLHIMQKFILRNLYYYSYIAIKGKSVLQCFFKNLPLSAENYNFQYIPLVMYMYFVMYLKRLYICLKFHRNTRYGIYYKQLILKSFAFTVLRQKTHRKQASLIMIVIV